MDSGVHLLTAVIPHRDRALVVALAWISGMLPCEIPALPIEGFDLIHSRDDAGEGGR